MVAAQRDKQLTFMYKIVAVLKSLAYLKLQRVKVRFLH